MRMPQRRLQTNSHTTRKAEPLQNQCILSHLWKLQWGCSILREKDIRCSHHCFFVFFLFIGATSSKETHDILYARQKIIVTAKAFGLQAIDLVYIDFRDEDGLRRQSREGASMGFTGKQVIHPNQIAVVQEQFSPSPEKIEWAQELISAFEEHQRLGKGAFTFRGSMIDMPLLKQARNIVTLATAIKKK
ncbi:UNVERIFIED_CONTAM: hypothetical protein H355_000942 [Colinus virginianus]|nr:hypothetical protein H355_000942 [Colinus virginianus]